MSQTYPDEIYVYKCDRIWFSNNVFVVATQDKCAVYTYPNNLLSRYNNKNELEDVIIKNKIQLIFKCTNGREIKSIEYVRHKRSNFNFKDDFVYHKNMRLFSLSATFNIAFDGLYLYRYKIENEDYVLERYPLYIPINGYVFDRFFFERYNLEFQDIQLTSNGKNFAVWLGRLLTVDMAVKRTFEYEIIDIRMTKQIILCKLQTNEGIRHHFLNSQLEDVFTTQSLVCYESLWHGFVIQFEGKYFHVTGNNADKISYNFNKIEAMMACKPTNVTFSIFKDDFVFYTWNATEITIASNKGCRKIGSSTKECDRLFDTSIHKQDISLFGIICLSAYEDRIFVVTQEKILLIGNDYIFATENIFGCILHCDAKTFVLVTNENGKRAEIIPYEMLFIALTKMTIDFAWNRQTKAKLESFLIRLCKSNKFDRIGNIVNNAHFDIEYTICSVYRKIDLSERTKLIAVLPVDYIKNITDSHELGLIFLCHEIDLKFFVSLCVDQNNLQSIRELYYYYEKNNLLEEKQTLIDALWLKGDLGMLTEFLELDLDENLQKICKISK